MGNLQASEMANSGVSLRAALHWHLTANHYPPMPDYLIDIAEAAIDLANEGQWDEPIEMPSGEGWRMDYRGRNYITASEAVESMHLDLWIQGDEWEEEEEDDDDLS
jgi:hypothetical protein